MSNLGIVIIGRNEGERLINCLQSLITEVTEFNNIPIVYVDSGSTDGSVTTAKSLGIQVIELDTFSPFTAARGRNTGFRFLIEQYPDLKYIQFMDGDCVLVQGWLNQAVKELENNENLAIVCGRRREKVPDETPYNRLADMEWDTPVGETMGCGGDALMRVKAIKAVNGFNDALICGEEPEMCIRLRRQGWKILRLDADMTFHDAAMTKFSQWWSRMVRSGWAVAQGMAMYGSSPEEYMVREYFSNWFWGLILPLIAFGFAWLTSGLTLLLLIGYLVLGGRIYQSRRRQGDIPAHSQLYAVACVFAKFPHIIGQTKYWLMRWQGKQATLIEYKNPRSDVS
ncbi:glycosyltransferase [Crocosphaera sp. UHCC 0190]|uniref:glycosyltransferase family 2 protein n=1 Tax=Crocosphaera sp. UHCC 0190 TaxID=3110246 RepID=UPI002B217E10|nr:glycosyltransferase [Crocosphaera sp. UHCC 0190]MEA5511640.1 glycosyltransferase [Crocosphaera sp. UHCC 0190]